MSTEITVHAPPLPGLVAGAEADALAKSFHAAISRIDGIAMLPRLPEPAERAALERRRDEHRLRHRQVRDSMTDKDHAQAAFGRLFAGYPSLRNTNTREMCATYTAFVADLPLFAIEAACTDLARSNVPGVDPDWPPTAPRVHAIAEDKRDMAYRNGPMQVEAVLAVKAVAFQPSPDQQDRVKVKMRDLADTLRGDLDETEQRVRRPTLTAMAQHAADCNARDWAALGLEPLRYGDSRIMSVALAKQLGGFGKAKKIPQARKANR